MVVTIIRVSTFNLLLCFVVLFSIEKTWIHSYNMLVFYCCRTDYHNFRCLNKCVMSQSLWVRRIAHFNWALCSGLHRGKIKVSIGCILIGTQRPFPSLSQLLPNLFSLVGWRRSCFSLFPTQLLPRNHVQLWEVALRSLPCSLLSNLAIYTFSSQQGSISLMLHTFKASIWLNQAHKDSLPFDESKVNPKSSD